jgi:hypothetical protein
MTDTATAPEIAVTDEDVAALSPEQRANAAEAFRKAGYGEEQIQRKFFELPSSAVTTTVSTVGYDGLTDAENLQGFNTLLKYATTAEQRRNVLEEAAKKGITLKDENGQVLKADGSPGEHSYQFSYAGLDQNTMGQMAEDFPTFNAGMQNGFSALQLPPGMTKNLFEAFVQSAEVYRDEDNAEHMAAEVTKNANIVRGLQGGANIARLARVGEEYILARSPGFHEWLSTNFAFHTAQAQVMLAQLGQHVEHTTKRSAKK